MFGKREGVLVFSPCSENACFQRTLKKVVHLVFYQTTPKNQGIVWCLFFVLKNRENYENMENTFGSFFFCYEKHKKHYI